MGNEQSQMSGLVVEEKAIEVTDFYSHHAATLNAGNSTASTVSIFIGEPLVGGSLWVSQTPLEKASKNLMLHRHPCILRYVSSWSKGSKYYLAVEKVKPLSHVLQTQSMLQICIGLHSILKGLVFLHERALASHNNVCTASIYVTKDGSWKLGGLEYLSKFKEITKEYMRKSRNNRYEKAIDPNEDKHLSSSSRRLDFIDVYAFAVLVSEVFRNIKPVNDDSIPLNQFLELCKNDLHHLDVAQRPKLSTLLEDGFFHHDFITIHSFLIELPLKSDQEKDAFFSTLVKRLGNFKQQIVAKQLGGLLLSRMVLLNKTAQTKVIPEILSLKDCNANALFDNATFKQHIVPTLLEIFCVRDAQIRLLLLEYFNHFMGCFTPEQLQNKILPELLLGIKDTNDHLVSVTLRALADLVPLLGSAVVIGGKRAKLFNDGLPITHKPSSSVRRSSARTSLHNINSSIPLAVSGSVLHNQRESDVLSNSSGTETHVDLILNERPSPDGEEGDTSTITDEGGEDNQPDVDGSISSPNNEVWDDWDINDTTNDTTSHEAHSHLNLTSMAMSSLSNLTLKQDQDIEFPSESSELMTNTSFTNTSISNRKHELPDILELDIKNVKNSSGSDEFNFFQDMEPVINTTSKFLIVEESKASQEDESDGYRSNKIEEVKDANVRSTFDWSVKASTEEQEEGWGDDLDAWD